MNTARALLSRVVNRQLDAGAEPITAREAQPVPFSTHAREPYVPAADLPRHHPAVFVCGAPGSFIDLALADDADLPRVRARYSYAARRQGVAIHTSYSHGVLTITLAGD